MDGYCEVDDVRRALQNNPRAMNNTDALADDIVKAEIQGASAWLRKTTNAHWYDSGGANTDVVPTGPRSVSNARMDVPSSPHRQDRQLFTDAVGMRYPVTTDGPYARIRLDHRYVQELTRLAVRDRAGDTTDWTTDPDITSGVGEDYHLRREDQEGTGASFLYVRAASIGARTDYGGLLVLDYDYGLDAGSEDWQDVRRGVAHLTAAEIVDDDDVLASIPDDGQLVGVDTQAQSHLDRAMTYLEPYMGVPVA